MNIQHIGLAGYGEVGKIFAAGLKVQPGVQSVGAWDLKFADAALAPAQRAHADQAGVTAHGSMAAVCAASELLISAVTASNTLAVAQEAARHIQPGTTFLDLNSASPGTKQQAAAAIEAAGAHYVEAGVMTSVPPYGIRVPMLLGGARAAELAALLVTWGMDAKAVSEKLGVASAIKMCRSVMIKGLEALVIESYATARHYGVEDHVLPTLQETFPSIDWSQQGAYFFSRVVQHGQRRAEEMREAANTVREAGFEPWMATAIADKHQWVADQAKAGVFQDLPKGARWQEYADRLLDTDRHSRAGGNPGAASPPSKE
jgi:3-hydroxyisobutyrate dehydrogenase-like beta-hydroxyacid dehydrogenase